MAERKIKKIVTGNRTVDGAGVHLVRVLSINTVEDYDPWLMLDSFDSEKPSDYIAGFPPHPHRGIETITYLIEGEMTHGDSLGNKGVVRGGESQWMTAGSGIIHEEMPKESKRMLGVQLWLNLPAKEKMTYPKYFTITNDMVSEVDTDFGKVRIVAGEYDGKKGVEGDFIKATLMDVIVKAGMEAVIPVKEEDNAFVFLIDGDAVVEGKTVENKSAILFGDGTGDSIRISAPQNKDTRFLLCAGKPLHESVAWGGPIVMNTQPELKASFKELQDGNFIKHDPVDKND